jgi:hypothetical protein
VRVRPVRSRTACWASRRSSSMAGARSSA